MPTNSIQNAGQVWGTSSISGYTGDDRWALVETYLASGTINRGEVVAVSTSSGYVLSCLTNTVTQRQVGIACATVTSGQTVPVVIYGPFYGAKKDNTVAITVGTDLFLARSAAVTSTLVSLTTTTGITQYATIGQAIAIPMSTQTAGDTTIDVFVCKI